MTTETTWEPGDPFMPDNGCGTVPTITWSSNDRQDAIAEDDTPPQWFKPLNATASSGGWNRHCKACNVQWRGEEPCWMCGLQEAAG